MEENQAEIMAAARDLAGVIANPFVGDQPAPAPQAPAPAAQTPQPAAPAPAQAAPAPEAPAAPPAEAPQPAPDQPATEPADDHRIPKERFDEVLAQRREAQERAERYERELAELRQGQIDDELRRLSKMDLRDDERPAGWDDMPREEQLFYVADRMAQMRAEKLMSPDTRSRIETLLRQSDIERETGVRDRSQIGAIEKVMLERPGLPPADALILARTRDPGLFPATGAPSSAPAPSPAPTQASTALPPGQHVRETEAERQQREQAQRDHVFLNGSLEQRMQVMAAEDFFKR